MAIKLSFDRIPEEWDPLAFFLKEQLTNDNPFVSWADAWQASRLDEDRFRSLIGFLDGSEIVRLTLYEDVEPEIEVLPKIHGLIISIQHREPLDQWDAVIKRCRSKRWFVPVFFFLALLVVVSSVWTIVVDIISWFPPSVTIEQQEAPDDALPPTRTTNQTN